MIKKALTITATIALAAVFAQADMTYAPFLFTANDASGSPITDGTYVMVLDLDGDGWGGTGYTSQAGAGVDNASQWLWDSDDLLMDRGQISSGEAFPFDTIATADIPATYDANVDEYYLLWFDVAYSEGAAGPGAGVTYGAESLGTVGTDPGDYGPFATGGSAGLLTVAGSGGGSWHNETLAEDVDGDGVVTPLDALLIINKLNAEGEHELSEPGDPLPPAGDYWDVTDDATPLLSAADAQQVIDALNGVSEFAPPDFVPEPSTLLLLLTSGLFALRRHRGIA